MGVREIATMEITSHCCLFCPPCVNVLYFFFIWVYKCVKISKIGLFRRWWAEFALSCCFFFYSVKLSWFLYPKIFDIRCKRRAFVHSFVHSLIWFDVNRQNGFSLTSTKNLDYFLLYDWFQLFLLCICTIAFHIHLISHRSSDLRCVFFQRIRKTIWLKPKWIVYKSRWKLIGILCLCFSV